MEPQYVYPKPHKFFADQRQQLQVEQARAFVKVVFPTEEDAEQTEARDAEQTEARDAEQTEAREAFENNKTRQREFIVDLAARNKTIVTCWFRRYIISH